MNRTKEYREVPIMIGRNFTAVAYVTAITYIVIKDGKVVRSASAYGADDALKVLKPKKSKGEYVCVKIGGQ